VVLALGLKKTILLPKRQGGNVTTPVDKELCSILSGAPGNVQICHGFERANMPIFLCD
jgi:hypothetical protein